jgi:hypothetical protein
MGIGLFARYRSEAALFDLVTARQSLDHFPVGMRVFHVHVERGIIGGADSFKSPLAAPEFDAALKVRFEDPHVILHPVGSGWSQLLPMAIL